MIMLLDYYSCDNWPCFIFESNFFLNKENTKPTISLDCLILICLTIEYVQ